MSNKKEKDKQERGGHWGKFQVRLSILLVLSTIPNGMIFAVTVFTSSTPNHRCYIPEVDGYKGTNSTVDVSVTTLNITRMGSVGPPKDYLLQNYIPVEITDGKPRLSKCQMFARTSASSLNNITKCHHGWVYDKPSKKATAVTEWDLVCGRAWIKPATASAFQFGSLVAPSVIGWASDRYGRRKPFLITKFSQYIFTMICALSVNPLMYGISLFFCGFFSLSNFMSAVIIGAEMLGPRERTIVGNLLMASFALGYMLLPLLAFVTPSWRWLLVSIACPLFLYIPYCWLIPESYRWLVQRDRTSQAKKLLHEIAKYNGISTENAKDMLNIHRMLCDDKTPDKPDVNVEGHSRNALQHGSPNFRDFFRHKFIMNRTLVCCYAWFNVCTGYIFFALNTGNLGGDDYINCFIAASMEIPASLASLFFMHNAGRRPSYFILMAAAAVSTAATPFLIKWNHAFGVTIAMVGKLALTAAYDVLYLYTPELFPTLLRYQGLGISSFVGNIGGISSPYIVYLGEQVNASLPYLVMGALAAISALSILLLPETKDVQVPNTIEEARNMKSGKFRSRNTASA